MNMSNLILMTDWNLFKVGEISLFDKNIWNHKEGIVMQNKYTGMLENSEISSDFFIKFEKLV